MYWDVNGEITSFFNLSNQQHPQSPTLFTLLLFADKTPCKATSFLWVHQIESKIR